MGPAAVALLAGSCTMLLWPRWPPTLALAGVVAACLLAGMARRGRLLAWFGAGVALTAWQLQARLDDRLAVDLEGVTLTITGTVVSVPLGSADRVRFRFAPDRSDRPRLPGTVELTWYDATQRIDAADRLELEVRLRRPRGFSNPGGRDNEARMLREGVGASGYVRSVRPLGRVDRAWATYPVLLARAHVAALIERHLGERPAAGIVAGLAVGLQDAIDRDQWRVLARSGTSHLMAISGLHVAMVGVLGAWLAARAQRWRQRRGAIGATRDVSVACGTLLAAAYGLLAGASVPTQRTFVMIACGALALFLRRRVGAIDGLAVCAIAVLCTEPLAPLAPGFWLSFGAVAAILLGTGTPVRRDAPMTLALRAQAAVTIGLVPALAASFGSVSLVSVVVNAVAIPLYTMLVVPAVLLSCAAALFNDPLGALLLRATAALIDGTWPLFSVPASWPAAAWALAAPDAWGWAALAAGTAALLLPLPWPGRAAGTALVLTACLARPTPPPPGAVAVTVLDVGQGLAVVVQTHAHALLYDAGPSFRSGSDAGELVVVPFLHARGLRTLDVLAVSHDDDDHKGGAASVLAFVPTRALVTGPSIRDRSLGPAGVTHQRCLRGARWSWDGVEFEWLHPGTEPLARDNDTSCVLQVRAGEHRVLLTGDVEAAAEAEWLAAHRPARATLVVAPHHGSRTSSSPAFVAATAPRWVVFAVGHRNRWGFPRAEVVDRWKAVGASDLRTSSSGAIGFVFEPGRAPAAPSQWRPSTARLWRDP